MSAAETETLDTVYDDIDIEEAVVQYLEENGSMEPDYLRAGILSEGFESQEYEKAFEELRREGEIVLGVEDLGGENNPYVKLEQE